MSTPPASPQRPSSNEETTTSPALEIGGRLATYRAQRGVKVSALAREIGVSASLISQIERGQSRPSVSTLFALSEALQVPVDAFFRDSQDGAAVASPEPEEAPGQRRPAGAPAPHDRMGATPRRRGNRYLVRHGDRAAITIEGGVRCERLTPTQLDELEFIELIYGPQAESHATQYRHPGTEMVLVLDGRLDIHVGAEHYELGAGDSVCFPSTTPHRYLNPTEQTTRAVTVILPEGGPREPPTTKPPSR